MENVSWIRRAAGCPDVPVVKNVNKMMQRPVIAEEKF